MAGFERGVVVLYFSFTAGVAGVGLGVVGFAPMLLAVLLVRKRLITATVGKGLAALAVSFSLLMGGIAVAWAFAPQDMVIVVVGALAGFMAMWAVLAAMSMSR